MQPSEDPIPIDPQLAAALSEVHRAAQALRESLNLEAMRKRLDAVERRIEKLERG
jgi:hypothetical protein